MSKPAWLKFNVEFVENGSDADTVGVALSGLDGCVVHVDGTAMVYETVWGEEDGSVFLEGLAYPVVTGRRIRLPLNSGTTITVI
jgi:hypothetical protein